jgi:diacylglycerol kinase (ATP)
MAERTDRFSIKKRLLSFRFAAKGILWMFKTQHNSRIHLVATILVIISGFVFRVSSGEWCILILAIGLVLAAEAINSSIESLVDLINPGFNDKAGKIKDLAAGGVLIAAIAAALAGLLIFIPKLFEINI